MNVEKKILKKEPLLTLRFAEYKRHAGINVLVRTENISVHEFHVGCHTFLRFCFLSGTPRTKCFDFQLYDLCREPRKIQLLRNFL
jgi:hypothetical protein